MKINELMQDKINLLDQFFELTAEQLKLLDLAEYEKVLELFGRKDELIRKIDELDKNLDLNQKPEELLLKLEKIQELNKQLTEKLEKAKSEVGLKLIRLQQGKQTESKYNQFTQTEGAFIDKKQ